jgi:two-component system NtrC family sensor kinase
VASRWRIRDKLLLGLGLVVGIMTLLLSGTSRGLYSYYLTTNNIRAKLAELGAAEELKSAVTELVAPENSENLIRNPTLLPKTIRDVRQRLDAYQDQLKETVDNGRDADQGRYETEMIGCLREALDCFQKAVEARMLQPQVGMQNDDGNNRGHLRALAKPTDTLRRGTLDLRDHIKRELADRLYASRSHYQVALWIIVPSSIVGLLIMAGLMWSFYAWMFNPIRDLAAGVGRVAQGDLTHRIDLHSGDEMEDLARAFNIMLARLNELYNDLARQVNERSRQLVRSERLASVGFLAAGVAHEINNPLASIAFCGEALEARVDELLRPLRSTGRVSEDHQVFAKYLRMIQEEAFRCKSITERLLEFSRTGESHREPTDLRELVQGVLDVTQHLPNHKGKHITFEVPAGGRISAWANGQELKSVILNLVVNGLESMDEGGRLTIRLGQRDGMAELAFSDTGCGMSQEVLENIFEPFFTRSRTGKGTGLGLTISHLVISQHGGEIEVSSPGVGLGSTFVVRLPIQAREPAAELTIGAGPRLAAVGEAA